MIDLTKKSLPNTVQVGGRDFPIYTDFRIWMKFSVAFRNWQRTGMHGTLDISYLFKNELPEFENVGDYDSIFLFAFPPVVVPHSDMSGEQTLFYEIDGDYIYSAFLQQYAIDLLEVKELHWHKFQALLNGIGKPTMLNEIMGYRAYTGEKAKDMDVQYRRLKEAWMPPMDETEEEKRTEERFNNFFD